MTTMLTLAPTAVTVPYTSDARSAPSSSSGTPGRAVRPLPRKQTSSFITSTSTTLSPAASAHGTPTSRSASASHTPSHPHGIHLPGSRSVSASVAGSSKGTPISTRAVDVTSATTTTTTPPHPAEPELRPSSTAPLSSAQSATSSSTATSPTPTAAATTATTTGIDIHTFNPHDLLRLLATLLTQIATTNDALPPRSSSPTPTPSSEERARDATKPPIWHTLTSASRISLSTPSTSLSFHARNVPTISLEAYLLRILKYCPTTNEVFLALLVYFDRMSKLVNDATKRTFVIDSFNVHRLVIAGVTVASKFFSDVFYTNSRYAKVGGLPLAELNQLELQFLLLNDFRLTVHPDEMQRYADQLILFSQGGAIPSQETTAVPAPVVTEAPRLTKLPEPPQHSAEVYRAYAGGPAAMGAFDAFGGKMLPDSHASHRTPPATAVTHDRSYDVDDAASECGTEMTENTETGTEGGETDDEPTIRPDRSCAGSECGGIEDDA